MACNCKNSAKNASKYSDETTLEKFNGRKIIVPVLNFFLFLFVGVVLIIILPFLLVYVFGSLAIGRRPSFKLQSFNKLTNRNNGRRKNL